MSNTLATKQITLGVAFISMLLPSFVFAAEIQKDALLSVDQGVFKKTEKDACKEIQVQENKDTITVDNNVAHLPIIRESYQSESQGEFDSGSSIFFRYYSCPDKVASEILSRVKEFTGIERLGIGVVNWLTWVINSIAEFLLAFFAYLILTMLKQGTFINDQIVKIGWPFIQGITNLGFIFVLLYIALATTLRIEAVGTSVQRLLPKLLIGALLVNFSLVIGGLLIDTSRLLMAVELRVLSGGQIDNIEQFKDDLLKSSHIAELGVASYKYQGSSSGYLASILRLLQGSVFRIVLVIAFGTIALNLLARYVVLLILLIFSPVPYLAFILPKTAKASTIWWGYFLKWVFYGPAVLFFLVIILQVQNIDIAIDAREGGTWMDSDAFKEFVRFIIVMALFFIGNKLSKKIAGDIGEIAMNSAKRTGSFVRNNPKTAMVLAGAATGGLGLLAGAGAAGALGAGRAGARGVANAGRDFSDKFTKDFAASARGGKLGGFAKFVAGPERDDKGKLKKGETSPGLSAAKAIGKRFGLGDPKKQAEEKAIIDALGGQPLQHGVPNAQAQGGALINVPQALQQYINGASLSQGHVPKALGDANIKIIIEHTTNKSDLTGLAQNEDYLRDLGSNGRSELITRVNNNQNLQANDKADIVNRIVRTVKDKEL
ncbi:MAG: hypothetical protein A3C02_03355 [Candidatus Andersenbacteria bacterium RIFCSPHIGHO2_02_FULL_45_11]|nr:MAG: hypothetical protein A3C02_03355 [Candidatus Andersenbacteria bacterium RIFCSPHIGHO2_02_FULL_45_11]